MSVLSSHWFTKIAPMWEMHFHGLFSLSPALLLVHLLLLPDLHGTKPLTSPIFDRELKSISIFPHISNVLILSVWDVRKQAEKEKEISAKKKKKLFFLKKKKKSRFRH